MSQGFVLGLIGGESRRCCTGIGVVIGIAAASGVGIGCCIACRIVIGSGRILLGLDTGRQLAFDHGTGESVDIVFIFLPISGELHLIIIGAVFVIQFHIGEFHLAGCKTGVFQSHILGFRCANITGHSILAASGQNQKTKRRGADHQFFSCHSSGLLSCF